MTSNYAPRHLETTGRRLWRAVVDRYDLEEHERVLLMEVCSQADICARLTASAAGIVSPSKTLVELRQQRLVLVKLLSALNLPMGVVDEDKARPGPFHNRSGSMRRSS